MKTIKRTTKHTDGLSPPRGAYTDEPWRYSAEGKQPCARLDNTEHKQVTKNEVSANEAFELHEQIRCFRCTLEARLRPLTARYKLASDSKPLIK